MLRVISGALEVTAVDFCLRDEVLIRSCGLSRVLQLTRTVTVRGCHVFIECHKKTVVRRHRWSDAPSPKLHLMRGNRLPGMVGHAGCVSVQVSEGERVCVHTCAGSCTSHRLIENARACDQSSRLFQHSAFASARARASWPSRSRARNTCRVVSSSDRVV